jgi:hypothetical protein
LLFALYAKCYYQFVNLYRRPEKIDITI